LHNVRALEIKLSNQSTYNVPTVTTHQDAEDYNSPEYAFG